MSSWLPVPVTPSSAVRRARILVVDDEPGVRLDVRRFLEAQGFDVEEARSCREAEDAFQAMPPDAAILDHRSGVDLVARLKELSPCAPLIVLTGQGSIELAVRAIRDGADQLLTKPVELPALQMILERVLENQRNRQKQLAGRSRQARETADPFLGSSPSLRCLVEEARKVVCGEGPVLIEGETGTGKGVLARWLHLNGPRRDEPFVDLNCAGLPRELLEAELFGQETGPAAGAATPRLGLLEVAHRGTLFIDEVGELDLSLQPRLLTVVEERRFRRLGDGRDRHVDVRLIAASHHDLARLAREARFHGRLSSRISATTLRVPPLRERLEDIPVLARHILDRFGTELGRRGARLPADALAALQQHQWPGNVRELRNVLEGALLGAEGDVIRPQDLRFGAGAAPAAPIPEGVLSLDELERRGIALALEVERGHVGRAALRLGVPRSSLYKKIKRYGLAGGSR